MSVPCRIEAGDLHATHREGAKDAKNGTAHFAVNDHPDDYCNADRAEAAERMPSTIWSSGVAKEIRR